MDICRYLNIQLRKIGVRIEPPIIEATDIQGTFFQAHVETRSGFFFADQIARELVEKIYRPKLRFRGLTIQHIEDDIGAAILYRRGDIVCRYLEQVDDKGWMKCRRWDVLIEELDL